VDHELLKVTLEIPAGTNSPYFDEDATTHPLLRRWDYQAMDPSFGYPYQGNDNALLVQEEKELLLEDGIQITFVSAHEGKPHDYQTSDYWLIPARTATGDVEWPGPADDPISVTPLGITHHYAPLAIISLESSESSGDVEVTDNCRCSFPILCEK
jgi:hypothetical protein